MQEKLNRVANFVKQDQLARFKTTTDQMRVNWLKALELMATRLGITDQNLIEMSEKLHLWQTDLAANAEQ